MKILRRPKPALPVRRLGQAPPMTPEQFQAHLVNAQVATALVYDGAVLDLEALAERVRQG